MRSLVFFLLMAATCSPVVAKEINTSLKNELVSMVTVDQDARVKCNTGSGDEQIQCIAKIFETIDKPNTKRLEEIFKTFGFPGVNLVGKDGFAAFMLLLQHSSSDVLRVKCLKPIEKAFKRKELSPLDYANFVDRLRLHQEKAQIYGQGFEFKDGKLVMNKTVDPKNLERRRAKIGLPTLAEYTKVLEEMYHLKVEVPGKP